ncbi:MAG: c-type cytochrome [Methylophagaceae bacterium]
MKATLFLSAALVVATSPIVHAGDIENGKKLYGTNCVACHQATGQGIPGAFPPLAGSDYLADKQKAISAPVNGLQGKITVNGTDYNSAMPAFGHISDQDIADIMTYVMNSWGNEGGDVTADEVAQARAN